MEYELHQNKRSSRKDVKGGDDEGGKGFADRRVAGLGRTRVHPDIVHARTRARLGAGGSRSKAAQVPRQGWRPAYSPEKKLASVRVGLQ